MIIINTDKGEIIPLEEFYDEITNRIVKRLKKESEDPFSKYPENLSKKQTAEILGRTIGTIDNYVSRGLLNIYRLGKSIRFKKSEVLTLYKNHGRTN